MKFKKLWVVVVVALIAYFVIVAPTSAANSFQNILAFLGQAGNSAITFFTELV